MIDPHAERARIAARLLRIYDRLIRVVGELLGEAPAPVTEGAGTSDDPARPGKLARKILAACTAEELTRKQLFARAGVRKNPHAYAAVRELLRLGLVEIGPGGGVRLTQRHQ